MSSAVLHNSTTAHTVQVWLSDGSSDSAEGATGSDLTAAERQLADRLTSSARRQSFETARRLGRQAVRCLMDDRDQTAGDIEILSEDPTGITSRPVVCVDGSPTDLKISVTHLDEAVAVAVADCDGPLGIDLARIQELSQGFAEFWMTDDEQEQVVQSDHPALTATMNWSAREAAFKAMGNDDEFRPAHWSVMFDGSRATCFHRGQRQSLQFCFYRVSTTLLLTVAGNGTDVTFHAA